MPRRVLEGVVVSDTNSKTLVVVVKRQFSHPLLKKTVRRSKKYHVHDEHSVAKLGDIVVIIECPPVSKLKRWVLVEVKLASKNSSGHTAPVAVGG